MFIVLFLFILIDYKLCGSGFHRTKTSVERLYLYYTLLRLMLASLGTAPGLAGITEVDLDRGKLIKTSNVFEFSWHENDYGGLSKKLDNPAFLPLCSQENFAPPSLTLHTSLPFLYHFYTQAKFRTEYHGPGYRSIHNNIRRRQ